MLIKGLEDCSICFERIKNQQNCYKLKFSYGVVCEDCDMKFSFNEKENIAHAFNVARGVFQTGIEDNIIVKDVLYDIQSEINPQKEKMLTVNSIFKKILIRSQVYSLRLNPLFIVNLQTPKSLSIKTICPICNLSRSRNSGSNNLGTKNGIPCQFCTEQFSEGEIRLMSSLFAKYGGFFNKFNSHKPSLNQIIKKTINVIGNNNNFPKMIEINEKALHLGLLCGYRPITFIEELKKML